MKKFFIYSFSLFMACAVASCSSDNSSNDEPTPPIDNEENSQMTVAQQKEYIEQTGINAINLIKSSDYEDVVNFFQNFQETYDLDAPSNWYSEAVSSPINPSYMIQKIVIGLKNGSIEEITRALEVYSVHFYKYAGIYEPGKYEWVKTANSSNSIVFKFNLNNQICEINMTAEGENLPVTWTENNYYDSYKVELYAPKDVTLKITKGNNTLVKGKIEANVNQNGHKASLSEEFTVSQLNITCSLEGNDSKITETSTITIGGQKLVTTSATIEGQNLCDEAAWQLLSENGSQTVINNMFKNGVVNIDVLGRLQIKGTATNFGEVYNALDQDFDNYDYNKSEAERLCQNACIVLNNNIVAKMYFGNQNSYEAELMFVPSFEEYYRGWEYTPDAVIKFADGSTYSYVEYFDTFKFANLEYQWQRMINSFKLLWN